MENKKEVPVQSVKKALDLLEMLTLGDSTKSGRSLSDLAKEMGMLPNSTHNLLKTMVSCGFLAQNEAGKYISGPKVEAIGQVNSLLAPENIERLNAELLELAQKLEESVVFTSLVNGRRMVVSRAEAAQLIRVRPEEYNAINFFSTPTGRVLAAYADAASLALILENYGYPGELWGGITRMPQLSASLSGIRKEGKAIIDNAETQLFAVAVPVLSSNGKCIGALGCHAPQFRCSEKKISLIVAELTEAARRLADSY